MNERIDHAAEAGKHIEWAHDQQAQEGSFTESVLHNATLAIAEATLALVEQQRIANLIEMARFAHHDEQGNGVFTSREAAIQWRADAAKALGLS